MKKLLLLYLRIFIYSLYAVIIIAGLVIAVLLLMGLKLYCIQTGSMEPQYPVGSMIAVEHVDFESIDVDDVISFVISGDKIVTHRVVEVDRENQTFHTKGDNNNIDDASPVAYKNVIGRVRFKIPYFGWVVLFLDTRFGKIMLGILAFALFGIAIIKKIYFKSLDEDSADKKEDGKNDNGDFGDEGNDALAPCEEAEAATPDNGARDCPENTSDRIDDPKDSVL